MQEDQNTLLQIVNHIVQQHPMLAGHIERMAAYIQGKGYGASTVAQENDVVHKLLSKNPEISIDIGGSVGEYAAELKRRNPDSEIHIFEPSKTNVEKLLSLFSESKNVVIIPRAVSDKTGSATLFSDRTGSALGSLTKRELGHYNIKFECKESVETIRFEDYWVNNLNRRKIDVMKIDVEGHELAVLNGLGESIFAIKVIQFEFGGTNIDTRTYFKDFWTFFKERNFEIYRITPIGVEAISSYNESLECFLISNFVAVNRG